MSTRPDPDLVIASWLRDEARDGASDRLLAATRQQIESTPQRHAWWPARRFREMKKPIRIAVAAAALAAVALVGINLVPREGGIGGPSPTPTQAPSPEPSPSVPFVITGPGSGPGSTPVEPGTYRMRGPGGSPVGWPSTVIVTIPDQWHAASAVRGAGLARTEDRRLASLNFSSVGNLVADPCASGENRGPMLEPPLGPSVDELVAGLRSLPVLEFTEPADVTLDGWEAKRLELTHPAGCGDALLWLTAPDAGDTWSTSSREGWRSTLWVLDIDGLRFVVIAAYELDAPADVQAELERMVDSIDIEP